MLDFSNCKLESNLSISDIYVLMIMNIYASLSSGNVGIGLVNKCSGPSGVDNNLRLMIIKFCFSISSFVLFYYLFFLLARQS